MKVLDTRVLLKMEETEVPVTKIGNMEIRQDKPSWEKGEIIDFGEKVSEVHRGDKVLIYPGAGKEIEIEGEKYRVISSAEIIVVL